MLHNFVFFKGGGPNYKWEKCLMMKNTSKNLNIFSVFFFPKYMLN